MYNDEDLLIACDGSFWLPKEDESIEDFLARLKEFSESLKKENQ